MVAADPKDGCENVQFSADPEDRSYQGVAYVSPLDVTIDPAVQNKRSISDCVKDSRHRNTQHRTHSEKQSAYSTHHTDYSKPQGKFRRRNGVGRNPCYATNDAEGASDRLAPPLTSTFLQAIRDVSDTEADANCRTYHPKFPGNLFGSM
jgi:hypothetical protein